MGILLSRLRTWLLLVIALPLARTLIHRLAVAASRRDPPRGPHGCSATLTRR